MYHLHHGGDKESPFRGMRRIPGNISQSFKAAGNAVKGSTSEAFSATGAAFAQVPPTVGDWSKTFASQTAHSAKGMAKNGAMVASSAASAVGAGATATGQAEGAAASATSTGAVRGAKAAGHAIANFDQIEFKPGTPNIGNPLS